MKKSISIILVMICSLGFSQSSLNDYQKAIVPAKFAFQKEENQYRINTIIKLFLKQKGFDAYIDNEKMPEGFTDFNCNKIFVNAIEDNTMFTTKLKIEFRDCKNNVLFATDQVESKEKDYAKVYNELTLAALKTFDKAKYKFSGKTYDEEEIEEKLKENDKVDVTERPTTVVKNELFTKVVDKISGNEITLYKTSKADLFLTTFNEKAGVVLNKNGTWFFECVENEKVVSQKIEIKF